MKLKFLNESYESIANILKSNSKLWNEISALRYLKKVSLKKCGSNNNLDNFQIFTPRFIVDDMIKTVGIENITNNDFKILEPTSGDGAFTCRILELRLEKNKSVKPFVNLLNSISTIYSIEMDETLVQEQRDNIYTIAINYLKKKEIDLSKQEDTILRFLIVCNFIWGETNIDYEPNMLFCDIAYYMSNRKSVEFPVWSFSPNQVCLHYEVPEIGD